jgi:perosamine synthetase
LNIGRTLPPAAAPIGWRELWHGVAALFAPARRVRALEGEIREHFGVSHVFLVSSGSAALTLTLLALKSLSDKTEVVMPAYTCFSVPAAILKAGLRPALCDVNPSTFDFDHALLEQTLTANTLCVIAHHLFGVPSEIERIRTHCSARGIYVVEDAAQAMGAESNGRRLGTIGDVGIFSLGRGKNITCGSGGIIVTNSARIANAIAPHYRQLPESSVVEVLKDFLLVVFMTIFIRPGLYWIAAALPFLRLGQTIFPKDIPMRRLSGMKAGLMRNWSSRLARSNNLRSETAAYFTRQLPLRLANRGSHP